MSEDSNSCSAEKSGFSKALHNIRMIFWPIYSNELKKFLPMCLMMMCILYNYTILRDTKDTLVIKAPGGAAECLGFLKLYMVTPSAVLFMILFVKLANVFEKEKLFYVTIAPFLIFFGVFAFFIYPNKELLHMSAETMQSLQATYPNFHYVWPIIGNWGFSLFYILAELWGSFAINVLFWQFANQITKLSETKRFYGLFGMLGNLGLVLSGTTIIYCADYAKTLPDSADPFKTNLQLLMTGIVVSGLITIATYWWMNRYVLTDPTLYQPGEGKAKKSKQKMGIVDSFKYICTNPYLGLIAILVLSYGVTINLVEGVWKGQINIAYPDKNDYNRFMGEFSRYTGIVTIAIMVIGNNLLRKLSWKAASLITPVIVAATSAVFFFVVFQGSIHDPFTAFMGTTVVMFAVVIGMIQNVLSKGTKYALFDSTKQMAYIPLDNEAKTKGQAAVEVIGGRGGKSGGAMIQSTMLLVIGGGVSLANLTPILGPLVLLVCVIWIIAVFKLSKRFEALKSEMEETKA